MNVEKYGVNVPVTDEAFPRRFTFTDEERAELEAERQRRLAETAEWRQQLDSITDPVARLVLDLHKPSVKVFAFSIPDCEGCDCQGYEAEQPDWPCRTTRAIGEHLGFPAPEWAEL